MPMEQETLKLLIGGFSIIIGISFLIVFLLLFSKKRKQYRSAYAFFIGHLLFVSLAFNQAVNAIRFDVTHPMASEEISLKLGISGFLWAVSMIMLLLGIISGTSAKHVNV